MSKDNGLVSSNPTVPGKIRVVLASLMLHAILDLLYIFFSLQNDIFVALFLCKFAVNPAYEIAVLCKCYGFIKLINQWNPWSVGGNV